MKASERLYLLLLSLYPRQHRRAYGEQMAVHFRDQLREAYCEGASGVARLWLRTLFDAALTIPAEHWVQIQEGWMNSTGRTLKPLPWWQIALIVLPGLALFLGYMVKQVLVTSVFLILLVALGIHWRQARKFPEWGLLILGFFAGVIAMLIAFTLGPNWRWGSGLQTTLTVLGIALGMAANALLFVQHSRQRGMPATTWLIFGGMLLVVSGFAVIEVKRNTPLSGLPMLTLTLMYLATYIGWLLALMLPISLGLPLARRYGLTAVLFAIGCLYVVYDGFLDPAEGLGFFMGPAALIWIARLIAPAAMLVVAPFWSMRAGSPRWRKLGVLIPIGASLFSAAILAGWLRGIEGWNNWLRTGLITFTIFLLYVLAVSLYGAAKIEEFSPEEARAIPASAG